MIGDFDHFFLLFSTISSPFNHPDFGLSCMAACAIEACRNLRSCAVIK